MQSAMTYDQLQIFEIFSLSSCCVLEFCYYSCFVSYSLTPTQHHNIHTKLHFLAVITLPTGAVAKYCNEHLCVCLCVHEHISQTTCTIFTQFLCMLPMAMAQSFFGGLKKIQEEGAILGVFFPLTMHCTAYHLGPIRKRLNRSRCRLG